MEVHTIKTKRLVIKGYDETCLPEMFLYRSDPDISKYQGIKTTDYEEFKKLFKDAGKFDVADSWYSLLIFLDDKLIGDIGLNFSGFSKMKVSIGYTIKKEEQNKGYGKEAVAGVIDYVFNTMNRHKIVAEVHPDNTPSIKLLESLGFVCEGVLKNDYYDNGTWVDSAIYAILKENWQSNQIH